MHFANFEVPWISKRFQDILTYYSKTIYKNDLEFELVRRVLDCF